MTYCERISRIQNRLKGVSTISDSEAHKIRLALMELDLLHSDLHHASRNEHAQIVGYLKSLSLFNSVWGENHEEK